jgi:pimeloyl-ACP methyl ester carboxylesterase
VHDDAVHYLDTSPGAEGPALLIIAGYLGSTETFKHLAALLSPRLRVVVPDLPGFGRSDAPRGDCTIESLVEFIERFVELAGLESFNVAGSSLGAHIGIHFCVRNHGKVRRLILLSPFGMRGQDGRMAQVRRFNALIPLAVDLMCRSGLERILRRHVCDRAVLTPEIMAGYWRPFTTPEGRRVIVQVTRLIIGRCSFDEDLPLVTQPTLVVAGSDDSQVGQEICDLLARGIPQCTIRRLAGLRHLICLDAPDLVTRLIDQFCAAGE